MSDREAAFVQRLDARVGEILARCSGCGRCVEACPTADPAGIDRREPQAIVRDVLDILRGGGDPASRGARWAETCTGSGACLTACDDEQWKMMQDVDRVLADLGDRPDAVGLDLETVREVMVAHILGEQPLPLGRSFSE